MRIVAILTKNTAVLHIYVSQLLSLWFLLLLLLEEIVDSTFQSNCIYIFQGKMVDLPEDEDTPEKRVDKIFQKMDKVSNLELFLLFELIHVFFNLFQIHSAIFLYFIKILEIKIKYEKGFGYFRITMVN